ncbi:MAG: imidazoleglycerol-phosphate dehydratase HisB [Deltaproteobacteria bacterium]|jgi:imidazoleglycerol-phosphate dehydratase|nr:imidazoleglycerol-phosphate dehydratase HisB [Deltaproteobacteria bacterium]
MKNRLAALTRVTKETDISVELNLDGSGDVDIHTGFGLADHVLKSIGFWASFDLKLRCAGDMHIDAHHTLEDTGLCLGQAILEALGDRRGIARAASARVPMDDALAEVCLDLSGRPYLVFRGDDLFPPVLAGEESDLWREFFNSLAAGARMNLHISFAYGKNGHHLLESAGKGLGLALRRAVKRAGEAIPSTKGSLD